MKASAKQKEPTLSVVMPVFNERASIARIVARVLAAPVDSLELIIVDDGSSDGTRDVLAHDLPNDPRIRVILHDVNRGKGAALRTGFAEVRGRFVVVQDSDEEWDPAEYPVLLKPLLEDHADVVFGSRFLGGPHRVLYYWHSIANGWLTTLSNMMTGLNLTDMETCFKVFRREVLQQLVLVEDRFGIEPEMTAKIAALHVRVYEVPVSYRGRTYAEGKKIGLKDAFRAVYCIARYGIETRLNLGPPARAGVTQAPETTEESSKPSPPSRERLS